jgi:hypothetical protein
MDGSASALGSVVQIVFPLILPDHVHLIVAEGIDEM